MQQLAALDLRKGFLVAHQGRMCTVVFWNILRNDRRQFVQMTLKDLKSGRITELKEHGDSKYDVLEYSQVDLSHSYRDGVDEVFYDSAGNEFRCSAEAAADALKWSCEAYKGFLVDGALVSVSTPVSVVATVTETAPPLRGGNSGLKDAVLDNGIKVRVTQLVQIGDKVRLDPETLEFRERA